MKLYKDILAAAWQKTIHQPSLWIFGLFAAFIFGNAGELDRYLGFMNGIVSEGNFINPSFWQDHSWVLFVKNLSAKLLAGDLITIIFVFSLILASLCLLIMISIACGALIKSATVAKINFVEAFKAGVKHWVALLVIFLTGYLFVVIITIITGGLVFKLNTPTETAQQIFVLICSILFVPLIIVISFLLRFTAQSIVILNSNIWPALQNAVKLFKRFWLVILEMALVNFVVVFVINLFLIVMVGLLFAPQFATSLSLRTSTALDQFYSTLTMGSIVYSVLVVFVGAILSTWQWIAWTLFFNRLQTEQPASTLLQWLNYRSSK